MEQQSAEVITLLSELERVSTNFTLSSLDMVKTYLKKYPQFGRSLITLLKEAWAPIEFLEEKSKYKWAKKFIEDYPEYCDDTFNERNTP